MRACSLRNNIEKLISSISAFEDQPTISSSRALITIRRWQLYPPGPLAIYGSSLSSRSPWIRRSPVSKVSLSLWYSFPLNRSGISPYHPLPLRFRPYEYKCRLDPSLHSSLRFPIHSPPSNLLTCQPVSSKDRIWRQCSCDSEAYSISS